VAMTAAAPAGFWRRYAAYSLDFAGVAAVATLLAWPRLVSGWDTTSEAASRLTGLLGQGLADALMQGTPLAQLGASLLETPPVQTGAAAVQSGLLQMLVPWLACYALLAAVYHVGFERSRWLGSAGKHALGLRVVDAQTGTRPSLKQSVIRHAGGALSWLSLNLGHALAALPPQKRALHDYIAGTRVVTEGSHARLPAWGRAWLALQCIGALAAIAWLLQRYVATLQASLG
jgi:uncharacterized RDD family membrane protein YckC